MYVGLLDGKMFQNKILKPNVLTKRFWFKHYLHTDELLLAKYTVYT